MMTVADILLVVTVLAGMGLVIYMVVTRASLLPRTENLAIPVGAKIGKHDFGVIERSIDRLFRTILVLHEVTDPENALRIAVKHNLRRGVKYLFLVSHSTAESERVRYFRMFETMADVAREELGPERVPYDIVEIERLPYDWHSHPYVLYQFTSEDGDTNTLAFRGHGLKKGIADSYTRVDSAEAHTIAMTIMAGAPEPLSKKVNVRYEDFEGAEPKLRIAKEPDSEENVA